MHQGPALLPIRTGAARIALSAVVDAGVHDLTIVPHALVYADRARFRSAAAVNVGAPIPVHEWSDRYRADPEAAVRGLTDAIAEGMAAVATTYPFVDGARVVDRAAALAVADSPDPAARTFGVQHALARALGNAVLVAGGESSCRFRELEAAIAKHDDDLRSIGLTRVGAQPRLESSLPAARRRNALELATLTPVAAAGLVTNLPVALTIAGAGRLVRSEGWKATVNGVLGSALLPSAWTLETIWACRRVGRRRGVGVALIGPIGSWALLAWHARWLRWRRDSWRDAMETNQPDAMAAARASRATVKELVEQLLEHPATSMTRPAVLVATPLQLSELSV